MCLTQARNLVGDILLCRRLFIYNNTCSSYQDFSYYEAPKIVENLH